MVTGKLHVSFQAFIVTWLNQNLMKEPWLLGGHPGLSLYPLLTSCSPTLQTKWKIPLEKEFQCFEKNNPPNKLLSFFFIFYFFTLLPCFAFWSVSLLGCHGNIIGDGFSVRIEKKNSLLKETKHLEGKGKRKSWTFPYVWKLMKAGLKKKSHC